MKGYTLIEVLVAIAILSVALTPAVLVSTSSISATNNIKNILIAANLAQEGIEVIHAIRDDNWFGGYAFDTNLSDGKYEVAWNSTVPAASLNRFLLLDTNGVYNYSIGTATIFKRIITVTHVTGSSGIVELKVISQVSWMQKETAKSVTVEDHLFDWK